MKVVQQATPPQRLPVLVAALGYGGLIPFLALALALLQGWSLGGVLGGVLGGMTVLHVLIAYGAVILSFVGALHWAFAMTITSMPRSRRHQAYGWSVVPALLGFLALAMASPLSCTLLIAGFALAYWQDVDLINRVDLPHWYPRLRAHLSLVACACLLVGVFS